MKGHLKKKIAFIICEFCFVAGLLTGCIPKNYSDELLTQLSTEYVEKAEKWFEAHSEYEATDLALIYDPSDVTNLVSGNITLEETEYPFVLNVDEEQLYTERGFELVEDYAREYIEEQLVFPFHHIKVYGPEFPVSCIEFRDMKTGPNPEKKDLEKKEVAYRYPYLPIEYDLEQGKEWMRTMLETTPASKMDETKVDVYVSSYDGLIETKGLYDIMTKNPGIARITFKTAQECDEYYSMYAEEPGKIIYTDISGEKAKTKKIKLN